MTGKPKKRVKSYNNTAWEKDRDDINKREGQPDSKPVGKYYFTWNTKGVRFVSIINCLNRGPLYINFEGRYAQKVYAKRPPLSFTFSLEIDDG